MQAVLKLNQTDYFYLENRKTTFCNCHSAFLNFLFFIVNFFFHKYCLYSFLIFYSLHQPFAAWCATSTLISIHNSGSPSIEISHEEQFYSYNLDKYTAYNPAGAKFENQASNPIELENVGTSISSLTFQEPQYQYEIVAKTGQPLGHLGEIVSLTRGPSVSDAGHVAFGAVDSIGRDELFVYKNNMAVSYTGPIWTFNLANYHILNNQDRIAFLEDSVDGLFTNIKRLGSIDGQGYQLVAKKNQQPFVTSPFNYLLPWAALNDNGRVVFSGDVGPDTLMCTPKDPDDQGIDPSQDYHCVIPASGFTNLFPMISNNERTVVRAGNEQTSPLVRFMDASLDVSNVEFIATSADFAAIGERPGISNDGSMVVFMGHHQSQGVGIFAQIDNHGVVKIAGAQGDGIIDPGEYWFDANEDGRIDPGEDRGLQSIKSFGLTPRVAVNRVWRNSPDQYIVVYYAWDIVDFFGLYVSYVDMSDPNSPPLISEPFQVLSQYDELPGLTGSVEQLVVYDPVNNNAELSLWVQTTAGEQAILMGRPNPMQCIDPLREYKLGGTDCVYRRDQDFDVSMMMPAGAADPRLIINKPFKTTSGVVITVADEVTAHKIDGQRAFFRVPLTPTSAVGKYELFGKATVSNGSTSEEFSAKLDTYVIFHVPSTLSVEAVAAYLYDEFGWRDTFAYRINPENNGQKINISKSGAYKKEINWLENRFSLDQFNEEVFKIVIEAAKGETAENDTAYNLMWGVSNIMQYDDTNHASSVPDMIRPLGMAGGEFDLDLASTGFSNAYGPSPPYGFAIEYQDLEGICQDYTVLLTAALRSIGIPARVASKVDTKVGISASDSVGFKYHHWTEAYLSQPPIGADPWFLLDAMDFIDPNAIDRISEDINKGARGWGQSIDGNLHQSKTFSDENPSNDAIRAFEIIVGDPLWQPGGKLQLKETQINPRMVGLRPEIDGGSPATDDALFEKCGINPANHVGRYPANNCPHIDPPNPALMSLSVDAPFYRTGEIVTATVELFNSSTSGQTYDVSLRFYVADRFDDGGNAFGDAGGPELIEGTGIFGETLAEFSEAITVPANGSIQRDYMLPIGPVDFPHDSYGIEASAAGPFESDAEELTFIVKPGFDAEMTVTPAEPHMTDAVTLSLGLTNLTDGSLNNVMATVMFPPCYESIGPVSQSVVSLSSGETKTLSWRITPVVPELPKFPQLAVEVNSESGGTFTESLYLSLHLPPKPTIRAIERPQPAPVGEAFELAYEIRNIGSTDLQDAVAALSLPTELKTSQALINELGALAPGDTQTILYTISGQAVGMHLVELSVSDGLGSYAARHTQLVAIISSCSGDFDDDGDVDGIDLSTHAEGGTGVSLEDFAAEFGNPSCP